MSTNKKTLPTPANQECTFRELEQSGRRCWQLVRTHTSQNSAARLAVAKFSESECLPAVKSKRVERPGFKFVQWPVASRRCMLGDKWIKQVGRRTRLNGVVGSVQASWFVILGCDSGQSANCSQESRGSSGLAKQFYSVHFIPRLWREFRKALAFP